jgi:asparagine synthase (glutamine-hydrolysing)
MNAMFTQGEHTWFEGIKKLLPGHYMLVDREGLRIRRWWDLPNGEDHIGERSESYYIQRTRELLEDSVKLRLRSDVPLGAHLSGGLDSSAIVALYSKQLEASGEPVRTFSGAFAEGRAYDERRYARDVVERYRTDHHEIIPVADDLPRLFERIAWHMDEPAAGPGILLQYKVCEITRQAGVIVINGGQGGDEAWGGYYGYIPAYLKMLARQIRSNPRLASELLNDTLTLAARRETRVALMRALSSGRRGRLEATGLLGQWAGPRLLDAGSDADTNPESATLNGNIGRTPLGQIMYHDLKWYLPALLQVEDRMSMAFSLESRAPLLDYRLVEHAASVPSLLKLKSLEMKHIFREAVKDLLPASVYRRKDKMGMPTPVDRWFRWSLAGWVKSEAQSEGLRASGLISEEYARRAVEEHLSGRKDRSTELWKVVSVGAWWRIFIEGDPLRHVEPGTSPRTIIEPQHRSAVELPA